MKASNASTLIPPDLPLAETVFGRLADATRQGRGIVRDSYGEGEQLAHDIVRHAGEAIGLEVSVDAVGNLMMTLPGLDRAAPSVVIGSHLDSVPQEGNYDGAAGVVAGLAVVSALKSAGTKLPFDVTVIGIRGEESAWLDVAYIGSRGALGLLDPACLDVRRSDTGRSLDQTLRQRGFDAGAIRQQRQLLRPDEIRSFLELHIEQGPTLVARNLPAAVVTGVRGCSRFRNANCTGQYAHSGAVNRPYRSDAVAATVALLHHLQGAWVNQEAAGADLIVTSGELYTDLSMHGPSKIAGETCFVIDIRSVSEATMEFFGEETRRAATRLGVDYHVRFELGSATHSPAAELDTRLRSRLMRLLPQPFEMPSGAGHDAAVFAGAGIPTAMIFVRNEFGSHNPDEAMALADFAVGTSALLGLLVDFPL